MKHAAFVLAFVLTASPVFAQLGGLGKAIRKGGEAKQKVDKVRDLVITEADERKIGEKVSDLVRVEFGVFQDEAVTKYVTLVGTTMTQASSRPDLKWEFIVLDTEGVNAFASPGGLVHITKGALGLIKSEAELAGVLAHEIAHITKKHTVNAIKKNKGIELTAEMAPGSNELYEGLANAVYDNIVEKGFDRGDEEDADKEGIRMANKAGYNPNGLGAFLTKLADRNREQTDERNGLFASHPETKGRIDAVAKQIKSEKLTATASVQPRYASHITFDVTPLSEITAVAAGTRGVAGGSGDKEAGKAEAKEKEKPKKRGFGLGALGLSGGAQKESTQASASAGNRAVGKDRAAPGGPDPSKVTIPAITPAELEAFRQGIAG